MGPMTGYQVPRVGNVAQSPLPGHMMQAGQMYPYPSRRGGSIYNYNQPQPQQQQIQQQQMQQMQQMQRSVHFQGQSTSGYVQQPPLVGGMGAGGQFQSRQRRPQQQQSFFNQQPMQPQQLQQVQRPAPSGYEGGDSVPSGGNLINYGQEQPSFGEVVVPPMPPSQASPYHRQSRGGHAPGINNPPLGMVAADPLAPMSSQQRHQHQIAQQQQQQQQGQQTPPRASYPQPPQYQQPSPRGSTQYNYHQNAQPQQGQQGQYAMRQTPPPPPPPAPSRLPTYPGSSNNQPQPQQSPSRHQPQNPPPNPPQNQQQNQSQGRSGGRRRNVAFAAQVAENPPAQRHSPPPPHHPEQPQHPPAFENTGRPSDAVLASQSPGNRADNAGGVIYKKSSLVTPITISGTGVYIPLLSSSSKEAVLTTVFGQAFWTRLGSKITLDFAIKLTKSKDPCLSVYVSLPPGLEIPAGKETLITGSVLQMNASSISASLPPSSQKHTEMNLLDFSLDEIQEAVETRDKKAKDAGMMPSPVVASLSLRGATTDQPMPHLCLLLQFVPSGPSSPLKNRDGEMPSAMEVRQFAVHVQYLRHMPETESL